MIEAGDRGRMRARCERHDWSSPWSTPGPAQWDLGARAASDQYRVIVAAATYHLRQSLSTRCAPSEDALKSPVPA